MIEKNLIKMMCSFILKVIFINISTKEKKIKRKIKKLELNSLIYQIFFMIRNKNFFQNIKIKLKKIKNNDDEMYAKRLSLKLLKKIEFWYYFF